MAGIEELLLETEILDNGLSRWGLAAGIVVTTWLVLGVSRRVLRSRLETLAPRTRNRLDDLLLVLVQRTWGVFLLVLALWAGRQALVLEGKAAGLAHTVFVLALLLQAGRWAGAALGLALDTWRERQGADPASAATFSILRFLGLVTIWAFVLLVTLDNLGFDVTALIAGLGIGGIAIALAAQNILGDLFASLSIALDKPFAEKDFLIVGDFLGSVERIGIKTTRLRSLSGEQLVFSNTDLLSSRIRNYGRMYERRVVFSIGVTYDTPRERLREIPDLLREAVLARGEEHVRFDRSHFKGYGAFSLDFETVYFVLSPAFNAYMDHQQEINLAIHEAFEQRDIRFAYPTQTLFVHGAGNEPAAPPPP